VEPLEGLETPVNDDGPEVVGGTGNGNGADRSSNSASGLVGPVVAWTVATLPATGRRESAPADARSAATAGSRCATSRRARFRLRLRTASSSSGGGGSGCGATTPHDLLRFSWCQRHSLVLNAL